MYIDSQKYIQDKKLHKLLERSKVFCNESKKVIHNFSSHKLSKIEESLLVRGLNFSILPRNLNYADYCINFELLFRNAKGDTNLAIGTLEFLRTRFKDIALSSFREFNDSHHKNNNLSKEEFECLKQLSINKDIVIQKSDKGNYIVISNKSDYFDKVKEILSDTKKFKKANIKAGKKLGTFLI